MNALSLLFQFSSWRFARRKENTNKASLPTPLLQRVRDRVDDFNDEGQCLCTSKQQRQSIAAAVDIHQRTWNYATCRHWKGTVVTQSRRQTTSTTAKFRHDQSSHLFKQLLFFNRLEETQTQDTKINSRAVRLTWHVATLKRSFECFFTLLCVQFSLIKLKLHRPKNWDS